MTEYNPGDDVDLARAALRRLRSLHLRTGRDVRLPCALGFLNAGAWLVTFFLSLNVFSQLSNTPIGALRAAQAGLLLTPTIFVLVIAVVGGRDDRRAGRRLRRLLAIALAALVIIAGVAPAFFTVTPLTPSSTSGASWGFPLAAPGFSLGVALGFAWGRRPHLIGVAVGALGGLGFGVFALLVMVLLLGVLIFAPTLICSASYLCLAAQLELTNLVFILCLSALLAVGLGLVGGRIGAALRSW